LPRRTLERSSEGRRKRNRPRRTWTEDVTRLNYGSRPHQGRPRNSREIKTCREEFLKGKLEEVSKVSPHTSWKSMATGVHCCVWTAHEHVFFPPLADVRRLKTVVKQCLKSAILLANAL
jgi:hypothetical protein